MSQMKKQTTEPNMFVGAEEYWSYQGLNDGYKDLVDDPIAFADAFPLQKLEMVKMCQRCYLFGFYLGKKIRSTNEQEKKERRQTSTRSGRLLDGPSL